MGMPHFVPGEFRHICECDLLPKEAQQVRYCQPVYGCALVPSRLKFHIHGCGFPHPVLVCRFYNDGNGLF